MKIKRKIKKKTKKNYSVFYLLKNIHIKKVLFINH